MTREQKIRKARELRAKTLWTAPQIGAELGVSESTIRNWWLGGDCENCGAPIDGGSPGKRIKDLCLSCTRADAYTTSVAWTIAEIRHWNELYGRPPSATDWNLTQLRAGSFAEATLRTAEKRHREDGPWPTVSNTINTFGSWNAAMEAAGFSPVPAGSRRWMVAA